MSWRVATARCGAHVQSGHTGAFAQCGREVTHTGLVLRRRFDGHPVEAWRAFACPEHVSRLRAARELLDRDRDTLADWRQREADALAGLGWRRPEPLAVGASAQALVARAEAQSGQDAK